jgi:DNA-binding LacI/PurR family transcriptional regulator
VEMGEKAVSLLVERITAPDAPPRHILLTPPISLRSSTAAPYFGRQA